MESEVVVNEEKMLWVDQQTYDEFFDVYGENEVRLKRARTSSDAKTIARQKVT